MEKQRIEGVNLLRIVSTILVLLFHAMSYYQFSFGNMILDLIVILGAVGTTIFFVLSGFSLRQNYSDLSVSNASDLKRYMKKRIIAIYPTYLFYLLTAYIFQVKIGETWSEIIAIMPIQLSLLQILFYPFLNAYTFNGNFWYISALFVLYILFPFINVCINHIKKERNKIILCFVLLGISQYVFYVNNCVGEGNIFLIYYCNPIFRIPEFVIGMLMSDFIKNNVIISFFRKGYIIIIAIVLSIVGVNYMYPRLMSSYNLYNFIVIPFTSVCILCLASNEYFNKLGANKIIKYISGLGLNIYLAQSLAITTMTKIGITDNADFAFIIITIMYAVIVDALIKPITKFLKKKWNLV